MCVIIVCTVGRNVTISNTCFCYPAATGWAVSSSHTIVL
jgi:hypothetical protein